MWACEEHVVVGQSLVPGGLGLPTVVQNRVNELVAAGAQNVAAVKDVVSTGRQTTSYRINYRSGQPGPERNEWLAD